MLKVINKFHIVTNFDTFIVNLLELTDCSKMELWETKIKLLLPEELNNSTLSYDLDYDEDIEGEDATTFDRCIFRSLKCWKSKFI